MNPFAKVTLFEQKIAEYYNAPYAVAVDCCTHGLELALRYTNATEIVVPNHTYLSVPMLSDKLNIKRNFTDNKWVDYYYITDNIIDSNPLALSMYVLAFDGNKKVVNATTN